MDPVGRFAALVGDPGASFALDEATLLIAGAFHPSVDIAQSMWILDDLADTCPEAEFGVLLDHLTRVEGFRGNHGDYEDPLNSLIDSVLARRLGIPITLAVVTMEVGRRLGVPVLGIGMPGHFLVRDGGAPDRFADPFHGGVVLSPADCEIVFRAVTGGSTPFHAAYLRPVNERAIVIRILNNLKSIHTKRHDIDALRTVYRLRAAIPEIEPTEREQIRRAMAPFN
jgi:regulator of sirC expression with transglutaminase-like and TPR domain